MKIILWPLKFYQFLRPVRTFVGKFFLFPDSCRFRPTCSEYVLQSVQRYGIIRGGFMGVKRIARCNPFNSGGYDPVP